jgi:xylan 1,4-beta-xylosidase
VFGVQQQAMAPTSSKGILEFKCDLSTAPTTLSHFWEHTVGSAHAPVALRADWQEQLRRAHYELGFRYVRFHGLLSDRMGTLICHKEEFLYSFFNADQIFDFLLSIGMKPFIELGFMPETLASGRKTVFSYEGNVTPPKDSRQRSNLIRKLVIHGRE